MWQEQADWMAQLVVTDTNPKIVGSSPAFDLLCSLWKNMPSA